MPSLSHGTKNFLQVMHQKTTHIAFFFLISYRAFSYLFICLPHHAACRILVPRTGIEPVSPAVEEQLNHQGSP